MTAIQIYSTPEVLAEHFAAYFCDHVSQLLQKKNELFIALSGGNTPRLWFTILANEFAQKIKWECLHFFWVDERYVPYSHPDSNYGEACKYLFNRVQIPQCNLHPVPVTGNPEKDVSDYNYQVEQLLPEESGIPVFDIITLGMGTDGHTASIFPGHADLFDVPRSVSLSTNPALQQRITLTGNIINHSVERFCLITGSNKAGVIKDVLNEFVDNKQYPISYIKKENTFWLLDAAAASKLSVV